MYAHMDEILSIETKVHSSKETKPYTKAGREYTYGNISLKSSELIPYIGKQVVVKIFIEKGIVE